jgi:hypothetical protein
MPDPGPEQKPKHGGKYSNGNGKFLPQADCASQWYRAVAVACLAWNVPSR